MSTGAAVLKNIRSKKELLFATFPMLFAIQQFIEGILWLVIKDEKLENASALAHVWLPCVHLQPLVGSLS